MTEATWYHLVQPMDRSSSNFITVLVVSAFISISLFETLTVITLLYLLFNFMSDRKKPSGLLLAPLILYSIPTIVSTALFNKAYILKAAGQALLPFLYIGRNRFLADDRLFLRINRLLVSIGILLVPVVAYKFLVLKKIAPLWGGPFEIGLFYTFFALSALSLFFFSKEKRFLLAFFIFTALIFFSTKRAPVVGFASALVFFALVNRGSLDRKILAFAAAGVLVISMVALTIFVRTDKRFQTFYSVLAEGKNINDQTLDEITSYRWIFFKKGLMVVEDDIREARVMNILIGHGVKSGQNLEPKATVNTIAYPYKSLTYESIFVLSEFIERGAIGLFGILFLCFRYFRFVLGFRVQEEKDYLLLPLLLLPAAQLTGMVFTIFWDAILPLYLLLFGLVENVRKNQIHPQKA